MEVVLLLVSFAVVLSGALLFTNAVEWIGHQLNLGEGAVGSFSPRWGRRCRRR